jgi:CDP-diacylglycerol--serine O-phosphatidyltransferase
MGVLVAIAALLMVSNFNYFSPKLFSVKGRVPFVTMVLVVLGFALVLADPPKVLLTMSIGYAMSGPLHALWRWSRKSGNDAGV